MAATTARNVQVSLNEIEATIQDLIVALPTSPRGRTAPSDIGDVGQTCLQQWTSEIKERAHLQRHQRRPGVDEVDR
jgi:hypothetical protein